MEIQAIGAGAVNQAIKSIIIARSFLTLNGKDIVCIPAFADIKIDGEKKNSQQVCWRFIEIAFQSMANTVIIPLQDVFCLDSEARNESSWHQCWKLGMAVAIISATTI